MCRLSVGDAHKNNSLRGMRWRNISGTRTHVKQLHDLRRTTRTPHLDRRPLGGSIWAILTTGSWIRGFASVSAVLLQYSCNTFAMHEAGFPRRGDHVLGYTLVDITLHTIEINLERPTSERNVPKVDISTWLGHRQPRPVSKPDDAPGLKIFTLWGEIHEIFIEGSHKNNVPLERRVNCESWAAEKADGKRITANSYAVSAI